MKNKDYCSWQSRQNAVILMTKFIPVSYTHLVQAHQFFRHNHMGGAGNRQQFGKALNNGQDDNLKERHENPFGSAGCVPIIL